ncbi:uncharacterized protein LOC127128363 [Lathyrus oleraceus]|uniref:uncharacterized protein LOC127128363 n=1 Tax=Pisum sativum TaxID=3888 RepID=UPI0021D30208|nr:uncharacterized protein LOC127128363 [Pisum sativum]
MAMSTKDTKTSQPVKLCASLQTLVCLTRNLTPEKKALMSNYVFRGFLEIENDRESSATLVSSFCDIYEPTTKVFVLNNYASFSFCVKEVSYVIGMENTGTSSLAISHGGKFP